MSIRIQKAGILDTIQDCGRFGFQHLGINPGGAMDITALKIANLLVGNDDGEAVLEMHFPAAELVFEESLLIALSGADFGATINNQPIPINRPILVQKDVVLKFNKNNSGARVYLAVEGGYRIKSWLNSYSTHPKVKAGGFNGRPLQKNDLLPLRKYHQRTSLPNNTPVAALSWIANVADFYVSNKLRFIAGAEYYDLTERSREVLETAAFTINKQSDKMGYRLYSEPLLLREEKELVSSAVTKGSIQLLPDGQLIILMAEHQTTGGYPRVGHIISADFSSLAQMNAGEKFTLQKTDIQTAEKLVVAQQRNLQQLQNACNFHLQAYFNK